MVDRFAEWAIQLAQSNDIKLTPAITNAMQANGNTLHEIRAKLEIPGVSWTGLMAKDELCRAQHEFFDKIAALTMVGATGQRVQRFTPAMAANITNFFFQNVFGSGVVERLQQLYTAYENRGTEAEDDDDPAQLALQLSTNDQLNPRLTRFYAALSCISLPSKKSSGSLACFHNVTNYIRFLKEHQDLRARDKSWIGVIADNSFGTDRDIEYSSVFRDIAQSIGTDTATIKNIYQCARSVSLLVQTFGDGIIPLLPAPAMTE